MTFHTTRTCILTLEVLGCGVYLVTDFTLMGNLLVNPEMLRKIRLFCGAGTMR